MHQDGDRAVRIHSIAGEGAAAAAPLAGEANHANSVPDRLYDAASMQMHPPTTLERGCTFTMLHVQVREAVQGQLQRHWWREMVMLFQRCIAYALIPLLQRYSSSKGLNGVGSHTGSCR